MDYKVVVTRDAEGDLERFISYSKSNLVNSQDVF